MRAEVKVATMLVQHNIPLADELTPLFYDIFPTAKLPRTIHQEEQRQPVLSMVLLLPTSSGILSNI